MPRSIERRAGSICWFHILDNLHICVIALSLSLLYVLHYCVLYVQMLKLYVLRQSVSPTGASEKGDSTNMSF